MLETMAQGEKMIVKKCRLCGTPGATIDATGQDCPGCGRVEMAEVNRYLMFAHTRVDFSTATRKYETSRSNLSFGTWILKRNFELIAKP
jgi:uncharacterized Zn finger protein (UPF0148 family)